MLRAERRRFARFRQLLKRKDADGLQQAILTGVLIEVDQGLVYQLQQMTQDGFRRERFRSVLAEIRSGTDAFRCLKLERSHKDAQSPQNNLLWFGQEAITPIDHGMQGLLAGKGGAVTSRQQLEALVQPFR